MNKEIWSDLYQIQKNYYINFSKYINNINYRLPGLPEILSEYIIYYILIKNDNTVRKINTGDLYSDINGKIEVKCFTSDGPISFGPQESWNIIYFLDARNWIKNNFKVYKLNYSNQSNLFLNIKLNKHEIYLDQIKQKRRPRITWDSLYKQIFDKLECIYDNTFEKIFENEFFEKKIEKIFDIKINNKMDYNKLTVLELKKICKEKNIKGISKLKKNEIINILNQTIENSEINAFEKNEINIPEKNEINIQQKNEINILQKNEINIPEKKEINIPEKKEINISEKNELNVSEKTELNISEKNELNISKKKEINIFENKLKHADFFCGTGAFTLSLEKTGVIETIFANDININSKNIYEKNFGQIVLKDINELNILDIPDHDILTAGFPCQPFSIAGHQHGFNDKRSLSVIKIIDIINKKKPKCFILENVKNLKTHNNGKSFQKILDMISKNYNIQYFILDTSVVTPIPQHRERLFILGFLNNQSINTNFEIKKNLNMNFFLEKNINEKYYYNERYECWNTIKENINDMGFFYQYRRNHVRKINNGRCQTLTENMGTGGHNVPLIKDEKGIRKLTPRECFNLQGFPENYIIDLISDNNLYSLAGNAVTIPVIDLIIKKIINEINFNF